MGDDIMKRVRKNKKVKYTAVSAAVTALVIAVIVMVNVIFSAFASKFMWYVDMTKEELFTLSESVTSVLNTVEGDVKIIFASDPDELIEGTHSVYTRYVYNTALLLQDKYDYVNVECHDVVREYSFFKQYQDTEATVINTTSVIVTSGTEYRVFDINSFYIIDDDGTLWAYNGEQRLSSAILQVTASESPTVCFTTKHGETLDQNSTILRNIFSDAGYSIVDIDLQTTDIPEECRIVIINNPIYDFAGYLEAKDGNINEIEKLDGFLDYYGCLMVFADYNHVANLDNLNEFLEEWGLRFTAGTYLVDYDHSTTTDGITIRAQYAEDGLASSIYSDIINLDTKPTTLSRYCMPVEILWKENEDNKGNRKVWSILDSYDSAKSINNGEEVEHGKKSIMALSREDRIINNQHYYSYVLACGSPSYTMGYAQSKAYSNNNILYSIMRATGRERIITDVTWKQFDETELNLTTSQAHKWTVFFTVAFPAVISVAGIIVIIRRKHS